MMVKIITYAGIKFSTTYNKNRLKWIDGHSFEVTLARMVIPNGGLLMLIFRFLIVGIRYCIF